MIVGVLTTCHTPLEIGVYSCTDGSRNSQSFLYDVRCAVVMHLSAWIAVY